MVNNTEISLVYPNKIDLQSKKWKNDNNIHYNTYNKMCI